MTDDPRPEDTSEQPDATATLPEGEEAKKPEKLRQRVDIRDIGPCKKHITVTIEREDIDNRLGEKFSELVKDSTVSGFRPGKAPRKVIERRFHKEIGDQVKTEILLASLEQLADENDIAPLTAPNIDPLKIELPRSGPLVYEFEVEVRPQFDLPNYKGLKLRRPVQTISDPDVVEEERRLLAPHGQIVPKPEGKADVGDILVAEVTVQAGDRLVGTIKESQFRVERQLAFKDGLAPRFAAQVKGANAGDKKTVDIVLSSAVSDASLATKTVHGVFDIKDVKTIRMPEATPELLEQFGVDSIEKLRELLRLVLERRQEYQQRQAAREQVLQHINAAATWELPEDLLQRQAKKALARRIMEMRSDGISEQEIASRTRLMQQDILRTTALALKEHFVLQKIAEVEKIDVKEEDVDDEIERLANQYDESPRKLRARLEKDDMLDALVAEMYERKALDLILDSAEYEDVPVGAEQQEVVESVEVQAVPGEMRDLSAAPEPAAEPASTAQTPPK
jgi:trigger factor